MLLYLHCNYKAKVINKIKKPSNMKKEVMKKAWMFVKNAGYTMSEALKKSWRMVKFSKWVKSTRKEVAEFNQKVEERKQQARVEVAKKLELYLSSFVIMKAGLHDEDNDEITMRGTRLYNAE